jgi:glyoxylase-like metal-dependent hydrolase (beta-lactamase superfamily II)
MKKAMLAAVLALAGCAEAPPGSVKNEATSGIDRMYVIPCGENQTKDLSRWTPGVNVGKPATFADHCYLIRHAKGWMLWDSGNPDRLADLPNGLTNPQGTITAFMKKRLADSLQEIGVAPADIQYFAMSHSHGDHSGNANLFAASTIFMQQAEYDAVFGPEPQKYGFQPANFEKLRGAKFVLLKGDHDVFGDGTVVIKSTPGHTPGHQSLFVKLPEHGPVLLSGDLVHLVYSWENNVVPSFNFSVPQSLESLKAMKALVAESKGEVWINHDPEQTKAIPKAPKWVE